MSLEELIEPCVWSLYSKKIAEKLLACRNCGSFSEEEASARVMRFAHGKGGSLEEGRLVVLYWLVDGEDGKIVDARFQAFGPPALIASADAACELVLGKNHDQARRIGAELIEKTLRDHPNISSMPKEALYVINLVIEALEEAAEQCRGIPLGVSYVSPVPQTQGGEGYPGWLALSYPQKLAVIEEVLDAEVRPYVELDEGGIEVQKLVEDRELIIAYKGACTSCYSSIGATLSTIQQIIQTKVHPDLTVVPNMAELKLY